MKHEQGGPVNHHLSLQDVRILNLSHFLPLPSFLRIDHQIFLPNLWKKLYVIDKNMMRWWLRLKNEKLKKHIKGKK